MATFGQSVFRQLRHRAGRVRLAQSAFLDWLERRKHYPTIIPPRHLRRAGKGISDYVAGGRRQIEWARKFAGLTPQSDILDIGCGDGRMAAAAVTFLDSGSYSSFEVNRSFVEFLQRKIGRKHPQFQFIHADLYHSYYNPSGRFKNRDYVFPYEDGRFDVVFLNSIFTHFPPDEIASYLSEIGRVLKASGTVLSTYLIATEESIAMDRQGLSEEDLTCGLDYLLNYRFENYWTRDEDIRERIVAVDYEWLVRAYTAAGLEIQRVLWGTWCGRGRDADNTQQDMVIAKKCHVD